jgi:hypothetical protein
MRLLGGQGREHTNRGKLRNESRASARGSMHLVTDCKEALREAVSARKVAFGGIRLAFCGEGPADRREKWVNLWLTPFGTRYAHFVRLPVNVIEPSFDTSLLRKRVSRKIANSIRMARSRTSVDRFTS